MGIECPKCHFDNPDDTVYCGKCATPLPSSKEIPASPTKTLEIPTEELTTGSTFAGRYQIIEELGKGGMGKVYKALDKEINGKVALKLIRPEVAADKNTIKRFRNELKMARDIAHRNVCRMYDLNKEGGIYYITMEYVSGEDLKSFIRRAGPLSAGKTIFITKQVCEGLAEAHHLDVVHRDLKPQNIMIDKEGNARIMDFGIARSIMSKGITGAGVMIGTPEYMSPEQAEVKEVDQRSDIYSLGVILYEMMTGRVPFEGETPLGIAMKHKSEMPKDPRELNTQIPEELSRVILRCMEKDKKNRYQSAGEVRSELDRIEKGIPTTERVVPKRKPITSREITVQFSLKKLLIPALVIVALVIIVVIIRQFLPRKEVVSQLPSKQSVAVLPFVDLSLKKDQEYFCDGMTDEIIAKLSRLEGLRVIPRTSMMKYKNTEKGIKEVAQELDVASILEGSVRMEKDDIRVTTTLINVVYSSQLWSETYDRKLESVFDIQSDIAEKIASALKTRLSPEEKERLVKKPTENLEAYHYYLKGVDYYYRYSKDENENAIALFKKSLELDQNYALAYTGLGNAYSQRALRFGFPDSWLDSAVNVSLKAISMDPNLPEAYKALGLAYETKRWHRKAKEAYEKAIELNPYYSDALSNLSAQCRITGEFDRALILAKKALLLPSPAIGLNYVIIGRAYQRLTEYDKAEEWYNKTFEFEPGITWSTELAYYGLVNIDLLQGNYQKARNQIQKIVSFDPNNQLGLELAGMVELWTGNYAKAEEYYAEALEVLGEAKSGWRSEVNQEIKTSLGYILWKTGRQEEARNMLNQSLQLAKKAIEKGNETPFYRVNIAIINSIQGKKSEAYKWLEKAIDAGWRGYAWSLKDPLLENLHSDERFKQMMAQVKAMVDEMRKRVEKE
jgi:protein kinase/serine/threonine-protein kinase